MVFIKKDLPAIITFVIIGVAAWFASDYFFPEELKIGRKIIPLMFSFALFAISLIFRVRYKKWIPSDDAWKDLTKNIK